MNQNEAPDPKKKNFQISELAGSQGGANIDDGQDFDPASPSVNEVGANDDDVEKNRGAVGPKKG